jgi:hypothetical protein
MPCVNAHAQRHFEHFGQLPTDAAPFFGGRGSSET